MSRCIILALLLCLCLLVGQFAEGDGSGPRASKKRKMRQLAAGITRCNNVNSEVTARQTEKQIKHAEFVFTGKVTSEFSLPAGVSWGPKADYRGFWVRVKRVLKGAGGLHRDVQLLVSEGADGDTARFAAGCYSVIRVHHTAIFVARQSNHPGNNTTAPVLVSAIDPLPITLRNLDQVNALVKDMTYKPRPTLLEEPCEKKFCPWGSNCMTDSTGEAHCECPTECPSGSAGPVCGTDDVTYNNQCLLRRKACLKRDHTRLRHVGNCGTPSNRRHH